MPILNIYKVPLNKGLIQKGDISLFNLLGLKKKKKDKVGEQDDP